MHEFSRITHFNCSPLLLHLKRRRFLVTATQVLGGLGIAAASVPFVGSMLPSSKALALGAPVEIDISLIQPGQRLTISWRGNPIFVVNRTKEYLSSLSESNFFLEPFPILTT